MEHSEIELQARSQAPIPLPESRQQTQVRVIYAIGDSSLGSDRHSFSMQASAYPPTWWLMSQGGFVRTPAKVPLGGTSITNSRLVGIRLCEGHLHATFVPLRRNIRDFSTVLGGQRNGPGTG